MSATETMPKRTDELGRQRALIDAALQRLLRPHREAPRRFAGAMRYSVFPGGKRFRPLLCLGACQAVGGRLHQAMTAACAIELIHCYSLVHDDLPAMDNAAERRGRPSCHHKYGEAMAILVGDALLTLAFECLSRNGMPNSLAVIRTIGHASGMTGLVGGQVLDLGIERATSRSRAAQVTELEQVARRKTAALMTASVVAGGLAGQASADDIKRLRRYGERLGLAFQLKDDLHDRDGLARTLGSDAVAGKAVELIEDARREIATFGTRARMLEAMAEWLARS